MLVSHVRNGKFTESWLMSDDQYAADEFFSRQHFLGAGRSATGEGHSFATSRLASLDLDAYDLLTGLADTARNRAGRLPVVSTQRPGELGSDG